MALVAVTSGQVVKVINLMEIFFHFLRKSVQICNHLKKLYLLEVKKDLQTHLT